MVRIAFLTAGYVHASEMGSLMQSHNANSEFGSALDVRFKMSQLSDLQLTTQRMEAEYKAMAVAIINKEVDPRTGNPYTEMHDDKVFSTVRSQFELIEDQLKQEKATNQGLINQANHQVALCNKVRNDTFTVGSDNVPSVETLKSAVDAKRLAHSQCRGSENIKINERKDSCGRFVGQALCKAHEEAGYKYFTSGNDTSNSLQHQGVDPNLHTDYVNVPDAILNAVRTGRECRDELKEENKTAYECDQAQDEFELAFCLYGERVISACRNLDQCYKDKTDERAQVGRAILGLQTEQKIVFRMIQKVKCYVDKIENNFKTLKDEMIKACEVEDYVAVADGNLTLDYTVPENKEDCLWNTGDVLLPNGLPGDTDHWSKAEYAANNLNFSSVAEHDGKTYNGTNHTPEHDQHEISIIDTIIQCDARSDLNGLGGGTLNGRAWKTKLENKDFDSDYAKNGVYVADQ